MNAPSKNRRSIAMAVQAGEVDQVIKLLDAGHDPAAPARTVGGSETTACAVALYSANEALVEPFVDALLRIPHAETWHLERMAWWIFKADYYSVALANKVSAHVGNWATALDHHGSDPMRWDDSWLYVREEKNGSYTLLGGRRDSVLAGKVSLAVAQGWRPDQAWLDGWLPHHQYISKGWTEAALACVAGGADPDEPLRRRGTQSPEILDGWPAFQAALRAQRTQALPTSFSPITRTRQRA